MYEVVEIGRSAVRPGAADHSCGRTRRPAAANFLGDGCSFATFVSREGAPP